ncbi:MAG: DUF393 domain-containing protein [Arenicella sp.]|jgi:predicted DCC family thiol-disulfide oxidoreductase YuxK|nr:DUF393 domain-containing protein [Arenicella sp.]HAU67804.1 DUF393 domain-containing protein [Gammaproteobacteria bacterium]
MQSTLFYDGRCAMCSKEMKLLRRLKRAELRLEDIHKVDLNQWQLPSLDKTVPDHRTLFLSVLHLHTETDQWKTGLDATVAAWSYTPIGWLFRPLRWPLIKNIADYVYTKWAGNRACKLGYV